MEIYTIGHSNYTTEKLIAMLRYHNIDCVVDIRGIPYSKYNIQFNKEVIKSTLTQAGFVYIYMAKEFAANRENKISYNSIGYADFEKVINENDFINGIRRLKSGCEKGYKIVLLGAMQDPKRCHRSILVGRALRDNGFDVRHILDDYTTVSQEVIEDELLDKYFSNRNQITIDSIINENFGEEEILKEAYRLSNKEIGYRLEKIK